MIRFMRVEGLFVVMHGLLLHRRRGMDVQKCQPSVRASVHGWINEVRCWRVTSTVADSYFYLFFLVCVWVRTRGLCMTVVVLRYTPKLQNQRLSGTRSISSTAVPGDEPSPGAPERMGQTGIFL